MDKIGQYDIPRNRNNNALTLSELHKYITIIERDEPYSICHSIKNAHYLRCPKAGECYQCAIHQTIRVSALNLIKKRNIENLKEIM